MQLNKPRSPELDLLRGVALFGILLINIQMFSTIFFLWTPWFEKFSGQLDTLVFRSVNLLVCQRFIGVFSLLIGLGAAIQMQNFKAAILFVGPSDDKTGSSAY